MACRPKQGNGRRKRVGVTAAHPTLRCPVGFAAATAGGPGLRRRPEAEPTSPAAPYPTAEPRQERRRMGRRPTRSLMGGAGTGSAT